MHATWKRASGILSDFDRNSQKWFLPAAGEQFFPDNSRGSRTRKIAELPDFWEFSFRQRFLRTADRGKREHCNPEIDT
jgi:hypothetical protein